MKKIITLMIAVLCGTIAGLHATDASSLRVYINPGHGSWSANDRPCTTYREVNGTLTTIVPNGGTASVDTTAFFESNTNLWKCLGIFETLKDMGLTFDPTKNQDNATESRRGAGLSMENNIVFSHVKVGPYPYVSSKAYNRDLSEVAAEVEANDFDMFISVHSNAPSSTATNYNYINNPLMLYRGPTTLNSTNVTDATDLARMQVAKKMAQEAWPYIYGNSLSSWSSSSYSLTNMNVCGDWTFYGSTSTNTLGYTGYLGVIKHGVPGYLAEGYHHTYMPARQRAMNPDVDYIEGYSYALGVADHFGLAKPSTGNIYGLTRDALQTFSGTYYDPRSGSEDEYLPLNGATVKLMQGGVVKATYTTDMNYNGAYVFKRVNPGTYTVCVGHPSYGTINSTTVTVSAGSTTYAPTMYINGAGSQTGNINDFVAEPVGELSFDFTTDYKDVQCAELSGKKVRRVLAADKDNYYILAHDSEDASSLYRYNVSTKTATPISITGIEDMHPQDGYTTTAFSSMTTRDVGDIALTADGYLLALNCGTADHSPNTGSGSETNTKIVQLFYWAKDANGLATGNPVSMGGTIQSGLYYNSSHGKSMTYAGTLASGTLHFFMKTDATATNHSLRFESITVTNAVMGANVCSKWNNMTSAPSDEGFGDYQLAPSHLSSVDFLITSQNMQPMGVVKASTSGGTPTIATTMPASNFNGYYGFRSSFSAYDGTQFMVSPLDANAENIRIFDITSGIASAATVTTSGTSLGTLPASARRKVVSWTEADQGVAHVASAVDCSSSQTPEFHILVVRANGLVSHLVSTGETPSESGSDTSFDFDQPLLDEAVTELSDLNIRRILPLKDNEFYVFGVDSDDAPHVYVYNVASKKVVKTVVMPTDNNSGDSHYRDIADIALTDDQKLVAISAEKVPYNGEGQYQYIHVWYWNNGSAGRANGDPLLLGTTNYQGYWNNGYCGKTMAFSGNLTQGKLYYPSITTGDSKNVRWVEVTITDSQIKSQYCGYPLPTGLENDNQLLDFQISPSPWTAGRFLLTSQSQNPREIAFSSTDRQACEVTAALPGGYISSHKGFRGSIMKAGDRIYFLSPEDDAATDIKMVDVTAGLSNPTAVATTGTGLGTMRASARRKVPWNEAVQGVAHVCGIANMADAERPMFNIFAVRGNGLVSHMVNYYEFDDDEDQNPYADNIDFNQNFADNAVNSVSGKNVRRIVANEKACYVLAFDKDADGRYTTPSIAAYDIHLQRVVANLTIPSNDSEYRNIGDISLTDDGYLVGVNASVQTQDGADNNVHFYYWPLNSKGISSGNPIGMGAMNQACNWEASDFGCSMTYRGNIDDGTFYVFSTNNDADDPSLRFEIVPVLSTRRIDTGSCSYNLLPAQYTDATLGDYQVSTSPLHSRNLVVTSSNMLPFEVKVNATNGGSAVLVSTLKEGLVTGTGFRAAMFKVGSRAYLSEPQTLASGLNNGLNVIDITDGLDQARDVSTNTLLTPTRAPKRRMPWEEESAGVPLSAGYATSSGDANYLNVVLLRSNAMLSHFSTDPTFELDTTGDGPLYHAYNLQYAPYAVGEYTLNFDSNVNATAVAADSDENDTATTGRVVLTNVEDENDVVTIEIASVNAGTNEVHVNPTELAADADYTWEVQIDNQSVASSQLIMQTPKTDVATVTRGGVVVFTDPTSPAYGMTAVSYGWARGIELYDANHNYMGTFHAGEAQMDANSSSSLYRGAQRGNKAVFVDWSDSGAGYWEFDPLNPEAPLVNLLDGENDGTGAFILNGVSIGGGATAIDFIGSGDDEKCFVFSEDYPSGNANGGPVVYNIGGAERFTSAPALFEVISEATVAGFEETGYPLPFTSHNCEITAIEEGLFVSQFRSSPTTHARTEPGFVFVDYNTRRVLFNGVDLPEFESSGIGPGLAISADKKTFAISNGTTAIVIYDVTWTDGVPSFTYRNTIETDNASTSGGGHLQMQFDPAGNLAVFNNSIGYQLYSVPQEESVAVTPAPSYSIVNRLVVTGVEDVMAEKGDGDAPVEYYNVQGMRINNPAKGQVVIRRQGKRCAKIIYK